MASSRTRSLLATRLRSPGERSAVRDPEPSNFLFLTQTYPRFATDTSGPFIRDLAQGLVRLGNRVTVLTPHAPGLAARWMDQGVKVKTFRYAPEPWEVLGYSRSLEADERIKPAAQAIAPLYLLGAWRAVRRAVRRHRYDLVQAHWIVPNGVVASVVAHRIPVAIGLHGSDVFLAEKPLVRAWVKRSLRRTSVLTGCSPELVERICRLGFDPAYARVIPYGVNVEMFAPDPARRLEWRQRLGIPAEAPLILSVGRMATKKGYQVLLQGLPELLSRYPHCHVVLAGAGDRLADFRATAAPWPDRVHFPGAVLRDTLPDLYRSADLFVLPAVHDARGNVDGLPNVILEAMASGLPVVASAISGIPLAVSEGKQGHLVPEQDPAALNQALFRLLDHPDHARALGAAGRCHAVAELTWDVVARRYREAYDLALAVH